MRPILDQHTWDQHTPPSALSEHRLDQLHVTSLIVYCRPERLQALTVWLIDQAGVEIPVSSPEGKLVVVSENHSERAIADLMQAIADRPGVLNTAMVYHEVIEHDED